MAEQFTTYKVDPSGKFQAALAEAARQVEDLTIPFIEIAKDWQQGNKFIYALKGPGKFADLKDAYKDRKQATLGFIYPILRGETKRLEESLTRPDSPDAILEVVNKKSLLLGTKVEYGYWLNFGTSKMKKRPFVMIGAEQTGPPEFNKREQAWIFILKSFVLQKMAEAGVGKPTDGQA